MPACPIRALQEHMPVADPAGWRCAVCGTEVPVSASFTWRCPQASDTDPHHLLQILPGEPAAATPLINHVNPMVRFGPRLAWWRWARWHGLDDAACTALTEEVIGDFRVTPYGPDAALSGELGVEVWVKDETSSVAGSQKSRHLASILLHLRAAEELGLLATRPALAIASCGNAAVAAATLARRAHWPLEVFIPEWMDPAYGDELDRLGAQVTACVREPHASAGDPAVHSFRAAVARGAIPFSVQGPENAYCLDAGRTLGWEIASDPSGPPDALYVQVGGGAFASCAGAALGPAVRLHAVQAAGCAPLVRAWERATQWPDVSLGAHWAELMTPWDAPQSIADGILDDETYDWIGVVQAMRASGGHPIVASEDHIRWAHDLATAAGYAVSVTGAAGLAGVLADPDRARRGKRVAVVMSGVARS